MQQKFHANIIAKNVAENYTYSNNGMHVSLLLQLSILLSYISVFKPKPFTSYDVCFFQQGGIFSELGLILHGLYFPWSLQFKRSVLYLEINEIVYKIYTCVFGNVSFTCRHSVVQGDYYILLAAIH